LSFLSYYSQDSILPSWAPVSVCRIGVLELEINGNRMGPTARKYDREAYDR